MQNQPFPLQYAYKNLYCSEMGQQNIWCEDVTKLEDNGSSHNPPHVKWLKVSWSGIIQHPTLILVYLQCNILISGNPQQLLHKCGWVVLSVRAWAFVGEENETHKWRTLLKTRGLKNYTNKLIYKKEVDPQTYTEDNLMVTTGKGERDRLGVWD